MDVNGLRCWQAASSAAFGLAGPGTPRHLRWDSKTRTLQLSRQQGTPAISEDRLFATARANQPSPVSDAGGSFAWWDGSASTLRTAGFGSGSVPLALAVDKPAGVLTPTDLAFGSDDILYVARNDGVVMLDRRDRWPQARVELAGFAAHRLAPMKDDGVWALDRSTGQLACLSGRPLRRSVIEDRDEAGFVPVEPNPSPPRLRLLRGARLPSDVTGVAMAASIAGQLAVLCWSQDGDALLFLLVKRKLVRFGSLAGLRYPYGLAWDGETGIAVLASDGPAPAGQAFVYELADQPFDGGEAYPSSAVRPLVANWPGSFCNRLAAVPEYLVTDGQSDSPVALRRLIALSRAGYVRLGYTTFGPFDSGASDTNWHRLYLEAKLPPNTGLRLWLHATDTPGAPPDPVASGFAGWHLHHAGQPAAGTAAAGVPVAAWCRETSEIPYAVPLLASEPSPGMSGLFTLLIQRSDRQVRRLAGRWLWVHLELSGDGLATPSVAALRVYGDRFSYRDRYLPAFYHEQMSGDEADAAGPATRHDFLERFLCLFEGPLTQLEARVADGWMLTDPNCVPEASLGWLGRWFGIEQEHREALRAAPWTARLNGTAGGLLAALELATGGRVVFGGKIDPSGAVPRPGELALAALDGQTHHVLVIGVSDPRSGDASAVLAGGAVTRGEIVMVEGWRLRRTFATILGADLANEDDPLTGAFARSGNSFVGDTLILGDDARREVMALFGAELPQGAADRKSVADFFERLAHRVLLLVRESARTTDLARLREVAAANAPAHVEINVSVARQPLMVGAASLVGIDTFLLPSAPPRPVRIGRSAIGTGDVVTGSGRLDSRADAPVAPLPVAVADGPAETLAGMPFLLSAARSETTGDRRIARNIWTWVPN